MSFMDVLNDVANAIDKRQEEVKRKTRRELKKMTDDQLISFRRRKKDAGNEFMVDLAEEELEYRGISSWHW